MHPLIWIGDILFPDSCIHCNKAISHALSGLCISCIHSITYCHDGCEICGGHLEQGWCHLCAERPFFPDRNYSITEYKTSMLSIIHEIKFKKRPVMIKKLIEIIIENSPYCEDTFDVITAVPMSKKKIRERGYNQSALLAKGIAKHLDKPFKMVLKERRKAQRQSSLSYKERFSNVEGRYFISDAHNITGERILLFDDVFTTGATLNECASLLKNAGCQSIVTLTLARV